MTAPRKIQSPSDIALGQLSQALAELAPQLEEDPIGSWPGPQLALCAEHGVFEWFVNSDVGGQGWPEADIMSAYLQLSAGCLTTVFVITQRTGACRRIESSPNGYIRDRYLPGLVTGELFTTVGISHLTTSRRHLSRPVLAAEACPGGFRLNGFSPWVTGAAYADVVVVGATLPDGEQILAGVPTDVPGVKARPASPLVALSASQTGPLAFDHVLVEDRWVLAGPEPAVMAGTSGATTGGLQTSTLALGLSDSAITFMEQEVGNRAELATVASSLREQWTRLRGETLSLAGGGPGCSREELRTAANNLVLRSTQAALTASKGTGYVQGHPAGRWCREALFFLVWSCPQPVATAHLCELAGIA